MRSRSASALLGRLILSLSIAASLACARTTSGVPRARNFVLITIDAIRADHVGAYGYARARTPTLDALARRGVLFERAYAAAPITLTSHATILSGRYPPGHGARDNGLRVSPSTPLLAAVLRAQGFKTAAFVAAFPLDHQFGLDRGFEIYSDHLPRDASGRQTNERPASQVIDEAIAWLGATEPQGEGRKGRFFLWVHVVEPHAPYEGDTSRPVSERYDEEIATVDREIGRLLGALGQRVAETLVVAAGDHGEAFGEHGEFAHSIYVYDTTLRVPLLLAQPGLAARRIAEAVTLADITPTVTSLLGVDRGQLKEVDGIDLSRALGGEAPPQRELYAESFAPLVEFGWAPLRSIRSGPWKYIAAPKPELFDLEHDAGEQANLHAAREGVARGLALRVNHFSGDVLSVPMLDLAGAAREGGLPVDQGQRGTIAGSPAERDQSTDALGVSGRGAGAPGVSNDAAERLRALGYAAGARQDAASSRPDPKDRRELAARIAQVTSGELSGAALTSALEDIVRQDPRNGQAHLRLGFARLQEGDCRRAESEFRAAVASALPSADALMGLATCLGQRRDLTGAESALAEARRLEPGNPVIIANLGILKGEKGDWTGAIEALNAALTADPNLHEARFNLALAYAKAGRQSDAAAAARELLERLPADAPQRREVERLLRAVR